MPVNPDGSWSMGEFPAPCAFTALAKVINDYCDWWHQSFPGTSYRPLSRRGVERLIDLAFYTSLEQEEGRSPRLRLFAGSPQGPLQVTFGAPVPVDAATLRRLAPSIPNLNHALWIMDRDAGLESKGIVSVVEDRARTPDILFDSAFGGTKPGLLVRVMGPGHLRASLDWTWQWKAGNINQIRHFHWLSVVRGWMIGALVPILKAAADEPAANVFLPQCISNVWAFIVESVVMGGHGGAFVIVPENPGAYIELKYPTVDTSLLDQLKYFWASFAKQRANGTGREIGPTTWEV
ncbi:MAG: putative sensor domain DACNV-containing protein [Phycisphaerae bacterium]